MSELLGLVVFFAAAFVWAALRRGPEAVAAAAYPDAVPDARPVRPPT